MIVVIIVHRLSATREFPPTSLYPTDSPFSIYNVVKCGGAGQGGRGAGV